MANTTRWFRAQVTFNDYNSKKHFETHDVTATTFVDAMKHITAMYAQQDVKVIALFELSDKALIALPQSPTPPVALPKVEKKPKTKAKR